MNIPIFVFSVGAIGLAVCGIIAIHQFRKEKQERIKPTLFDLEHRFQNYHWN